MFLLVVIFALASSVLQSLSDVIQHKAIFRPNDRLDGARSADIGPGAIGALFRNRLWLFGFGLIIVGFLFQALALAVGQLVTVQTVLVSMLVWVLVFAVIVEHVKLTRLEYLGSAPVILGLLIFVFVVTPDAGPSVVKSVGWAIAGVVTLAVCAVLIGIGRVSRPGRAAALIGTAAGLVNGLAAGLTAVSLNVLGNDGIGGLASNWLLYATIAALLLGVLFPVWAFQAGPVTASMPPLVVFNPALAYLLGIWLLDEQIHETVLDLVFVGFAWALMLCGILVLSRSKVIAAEFAEEEL